MCVRYNWQLDRVEVWCKDHGIWLARPLKGTVAAEAFPGSTGYFTRQDEAGRRIMIEGQWGMTPFWAKDPRFGRVSAYNARAESVCEKPTFCRAFAERRCLVPATGFFERADGWWLRFHLPHEAPMAFAGLYEESSKMCPSESYALITTVPNQKVSQVHDRMPVILAEENYDDWLSPDAEPKLLRALLVPYEERSLQVEKFEPIGARKKG